MSDLVTKLSSFLSDEGWTVDQLNTGAGKAAWHRGTVYVSVRWESSSSLYLGLYHSLGFVSTSTDPGNHTDDSGNGQVSGTDSVIQTGRRALVGPAPLQYWAFSGTDYFHVVVQQLTARYTHFGWGTLSKVGDWVGGEYAFGTRQQFGFNQPYTLPGATCLLDALADNNGSSPQPTDMELYVATVHAEGLTNQAGNSKWGVCVSSGQNSAQLGTDRATHARVHLLGGFRGGLVASGMGSFAGAITQVHVPQYPITCSHFDRTTGDIRVLGFMPDVRGMSIQNFAAGDRISRGNYDWMVFPTGEKWVSGDLTNTSGFSGISYRVAP